MYKFLSSSIDINLLFLLHSLFTSHRLIKINITDLERSMLGKLMITKISNQWTYCNLQIII